MNNKANSSRGIRKKVLPSFFELFKALGYLDIFLLIVSHALKRMKQDPKIVEMLRVALRMMEKFVGNNKNLKQVPLTAVQK